MKTFLVILLLFIPTVVQAQGVEASKIRKTVFANLGTATNGQVRRCTDCAITAGTAVCATGGSGAWASANGTSWICTTNISSGGTVTSVSGTANQISVATGTTTPVISITSNPILPGTVTMTSPKIITDISDTNGNELFKFTATGSAVNEFTVANAAASSEPTISATGSDTDIDINLTPKGTGQVVNSGSYTGVSFFTTTGDFTSAPTKAFYWSGRAVIRSPANGQVLFTDNAETAGADLKAGSYSTFTNCADSAGAAACGSAAAGHFVIDAASTSTVVSTDKITANSQVHLTTDSSVGTRLSVTCNTQSSLVLGTPRVTARTPGTSFTVTIDAGPTTDPLCVGFKLTN